MRVLLISDIHSNLEALEACIAAFPSYDRVANLGDVVGYGASPNAVVERVREFQGVLVRGNHDRAASGLIDISEFNPIAGFAALWTREELTSDNREWVRTLPEGPIRDSKLADVQFVHGSPQDEDEYILNEPGARYALEDTEPQVTFYGHTHMQCAISLHNDKVNYMRPLALGDQQATFRLHLEHSRKYLINPGSIGQPRDGDARAGFAVYDSDSQIVTFYRVPYDVEKAQKKILEAGLPERLATRLSEGH